MPALGVKVISDGPTSYPPRSSHCHYSYSCRHVGPDDEPTAAIHMVGHTWELQGADGQIFLVAQIGPKCHLITDLEDTLRDTFAVQHMTKRTCSAHVFLSLTSGVESNLMMLCGVFLNTNKKFTFSVSKETHVHVQPLLFLTIYFYVHTCDKCKTVCIHLYTRYKRKRSF